MFLELLGIWNFPRHRDKAIFPLGLGKSYGSVFGSGWNLTFNTGNISSLLRKRGPNPKGETIFWSHTESIFIF